MKSLARVVAEARGDGATAIVDAYSHSPIALRMTPEALYLVGSAQGLLDDDDLELDISIRRGAHLAIRSAAAMIAYASSSARLRIRVAIDEGGSLEWRPEPLVATARCHLRLSAEIEMAANATLDWTDECVLGRVEEEPGQVELNLAVERGDVPIIRHQLVAGSKMNGWNGPAVLGEFRAVGLRVVVVDGATTVASDRCWARMPLDSGGYAVSAVGSDLIDLRAAMADALIGA